MTGPAQRAAAANISGAEDDDSALANVVNNLIDDEAEAAKAEDNGGIPSIALLVLVLVRVKSFSNVEESFYVHST